MGSLFGKKKKEKTPPPPTISKEEKAILDCKLCRDKIKKYIKSCEKNAATRKEQCKEALKAKNREKAGMLMKMSKMFTAQIKAAEGQLSTIEEQIQAIENATNTRDVFTVLKEGNEAIKQLQSEVSVEKFEELKDDLDEMKAHNDEINEIFKAKGMESIDEDVEKELESLMEQSNKQGVIDLPSANNEKLEEDKQEEKVKQKKQMVEA